MSFGDREEIAEEESQLNSSLSEKILFVMDQSIDPSNASNISLDVYERRGSE